jgi:hypothetical protein
MMNKNLMGAMNAMDQGGQNRPGSAPPVCIDDSAEQPQRGAVFSADHLGLELFTSTEATSTQPLAPQQTPQLGRKHAQQASSGGGGMMSSSEAKLNDQSFLSDPEYIKYYYANKNINPRLPPPNVGQNRTSVDWGMLDNAWAKGQAMLSPGPAQVGPSVLHACGHVACLTTAHADTPLMHACRRCRWGPCRGPLPRRPSTCSSPLSFQ